MTQKNIEKWHEGHRKAQPRRYQAALFICRRIGMIKKYVPPGLAQGEQYWISK